MRVEGDGQVLHRVHVERRGRRAAPAVVALACDDAVARGVDDHRESQPEAHPAQRRLGEQRPAEGLQVLVPGQVVADHVRDGARPEQPAPVVGTTAAQQFDEPQVVTRRRHQPATAGQERRLRVRGGVEPLAEHHPCGRSARLPRRGQVQPGQRLEVVALAQAERRVPHAERGEDPLLEELVQRLPGENLDQAAENVGGDAVVPVAAGLEDQRHRRPLAADLGGVGTGRRAPLVAHRAVHRVDGVGVVEAVGQPGHVGQQVPHPDRLDLGGGDRLLGRPGDVDAGLGELRQPLRDGVVELEGAFLVQHHRRDRGDRLGHREDPPAGVLLHRQVALDVAGAVLPDVHEPAVPGDGDEETGQLPVVHPAGQPPVDPLQAAGVDADLRGVRADRQVAAHVCPPVRKRRPPSDGPWTRILAHDAVGRTTRVRRPPDGGGRPPCRGPPRACERRGARGSLLRPGRSSRPS
ncbi:MAG: hypothetical protein JWQ37_2451 [Blastococcus sp.]|nr:hypothetical protein [Blastococcus sp.]